MTSDNGFFMNFITVIGELTLFLSYLVYLQYKDIHQRLWLFVFMGISCLITVPFNPYLGKELSERIIQSLSGSAIGVIFFSLCLFLEKRSQKNKRLTFHDVFMVFIIGCLLGPGGLFLSVLAGSLLSVLIRALIFLIHLFKEDCPTPHTLGPFLVIGTLFYLIAQL